MRTLNIVKAAKSMIQSHAENWHCCFWGIYKLVTGEMLLSFHQERIFVKYNNNKVTAASLCWRQSAGWLKMLYAKILNELLFYACQKDLNKWQILTNFPLHRDRGPNVFCGIFLYFQQLTTILEFIIYNFFILLLLIPALINETTKKDIYYYLPFFFCQNSLTAVLCWHFH